MCGCDRKFNQYAAMYTNAGLPVHIHSDGTNGGGGPDGANNNDAKNNAVKMVAVGWIKRGW